DLREQLVHPRRSLLPFREPVREPRIVIRARRGLEHARARLAHTPRRLFTGLLPGLLAGSAPHVNRRLAHLAMERRGRNARSTRLGQDAALFRRRERSPSRALRRGSVASSRLPCLLCCHLSSPDSPPLHATSLRRARAAASKALPTFDRATRAAPGPRR